MIYAHLAPKDLFVGADVLDQMSPTVSDGSTNVVSMGPMAGTNRGPKGPNVSGP